MNMPRLSEPINAESFGGEAEYVPPDPPSNGELIISSQQSVITAQRVAVPRQDVRILQKLAALCGSFGTSYIYSWEVNDRQNKRKQTIEGPTIKLANDLARTYGNCVVDTRVVNEPDSWLIYARFTDLETGYSLTRPFQQRKSQKLGMKDRDAGRENDIVFQIGVSKAIRNVVVNALPSYVAFMVEESKKGLIAWVEKHSEKAKAWIIEIAGKHDIDLMRVEAVVGRKVKDWTYHDMAKVMMELRGIDDGLSVADEVYPSTDDAAVVTADKAEKDKAGREGADAAKSKREKREKTDGGGAGGGTPPPDGSGGGASTSPDGSAGGGASSTEGSAPKTDALTDEEKADRAKALQQARNAEQSQREREAEREAAALAENDDVSLFGGKS